MINLLYNRKKPSKIGNLQLDALLEDNQDYVNEVSKYPQESGGIFSDHISKEPDRLTITGLVSNSPINFWSNQYTESDITIVASALNTLLDLAGRNYPGDESTKEKEPKIIDVVTGLRTYTGMVITRLTIPRNTRSGQSLTFTADLEKITFVENKFKIIQNVSNLDGKASRIEDQAPSKVDMNNQNTKPVDKSMLKTSVDKVSNFIGGLF